MNKAAMTPQELADIDNGLADLCGYPKGFFLPKCTASWDNLMRALDAFRSQQGFLENALERELDRAFFPNSETGYPIALDSVGTVAAMLVAGPAPVAKALLNAWKDVGKPAEAACNWCGNRPIVVIGLCGECRDLVQKLKAKGWISEGQDGMSWRRPEPVKTEQP